MSYSKLAFSFPFRKFVAVGDLVANFEEKLNILHCAGEVPLGIKFVRHLVVMFRDKLIALLFSVLWRFADNLDTARKVQYGHAGFSEFETVDPIEAAFLRFAVCLHHAPLSRRGLA